VDTPLLEWVHVAILAISFSEAKKIRVTFSGNTDFEFRIRVFV